MKKGALIFNKYYFDSGLDYVKSRLEDEFLKRDVVITELNLYASFGLDILFEDISFAVFFDKDVELSRFLERRGVCVFNPTDVTETCDDKIKTYSALYPLDIRMPKTISAPLMFDVNKDIVDNVFIEHVVRELGFPIVVKENRGSQGRQVYLAQDMAQLEELYARLKRVPHHYQSFTGEVMGRDLRAYVIGGEVVSFAVRHNTTDFRSNVGAGGVLRLEKPDAIYYKTAFDIAKKLNLAYGSVDFIEDSGPVFIEANSNAYFKAVESAGVDIAGRLADYIIRVV